MTNDIGTFDDSPTAPPSLFRWQRVPHYYGDIERRLFMAAGAIMLFGIFNFRPYIAAPLYLSVLGIVVLVTAAGMISPHQRWLAVGNAFIALTGTVIFGFAAADDRAYFTVYESALPAALAWTDLALAMIFLTALYFSVKTLRWRFTKGKIQLIHKRLERTRHAAPPTI
jgi:hypothetical protein